MRYVARASLQLAVLMMMISSSTAVTMAWTPVGNLGNACDPQLEGCFGAVGYDYSIGTYEVTNAQYTEFLNAVARTDTYALYSYPNMGDAEAHFNGFGGITRSGSSGSYSYRTIAGRENMPVNQVSFWDALRFANWLHNGQPTGLQGVGTTETGAYTITNEGIVANSIMRNTGATIVLASEDEWYKAAYYDSATRTYFDYPTSSNTAPTCTKPTATSNRANCYNFDDSSQMVGDLTARGSYPGSPSPYGTFDQAGNVVEWTEAIVPNYPYTIRISRGSGFEGGAEGNQASKRGLGYTWVEIYSVGFRVATIPGGYVPEPSTGLLVMVGLLGLAGWRRARA